MSDLENLPLDQVLEGECVQILETLPAESVDLVFADPPYNLQLHQELWRPNLSRVDPVDDDWDRFADFRSYDEFTVRWLNACRRVLKRSGSIWVIGTYHNIYRIGSAMQNLGFWILNDIVWIKDNPMPNFRGVRFTNAHEMLIWAQKERGASNTFNYHAVKALNEGLQMRSEWHLPICTGPERLKVNGEKAHATQKPEALLYRVVLSSTNVGDVILDPFFGTGTTGVIARRLGRRWIGIEQQADYVELARRRIEAVEPASLDRGLFSTPNPRKQPRIPFGMLLEYGLIQPGDQLFFGKNGQAAARVLADGSIEYNGFRGSIHQVARQICQAPSNGWEQWFYFDPASGERQPIDYLRQQLRALSGEEPQENPPTV